MTNPGQRLASRSWPGACLSGRHAVWFAVAAAFLAAATGDAADAAEGSWGLPLPVQRSLEREDWPALLQGLAGNPLATATVRLVAARALFETGRLPEEQFSWFRSPGPELLSTSDLKDYAGSAHFAEALLQLGYANGAERLAFDSLEMEGENAPALRTLVRLHLVKGLTNAARIFLNRLDAYPERQPWVARVRAALATHTPAMADPTLLRIGTNLVTRDRIAAGLTTERLLRQALEANPENRMAFEFLMAHQLVTRRLLYAVRTLATTRPGNQDPLPRHHAEAVVLHRSLYPGISLDALAPRVPHDVLARFQGFHELMQRAAGSLEQVRPQAQREFGNTYWFFYFFAPPEPASVAPAPETPQARE